MEEFPGRPVRAFVVWEPVLVTDWGRPSTAALGRVPDVRAAQYWDRDRLVSHSWGEHGRKTIVWDDISVYPPGVLWQHGPPKPLFRGRTVVSKADAVRAAMGQALQGMSQAR